MGCFEHQRQRDEKYRSGQQFHENLDRRLANGAEYITARGRPALASAHCGKNPKKTAQMTANNYRPLGQAVKTPKTTISSGSETPSRVHIEYSAHDTPRIA